MQFGMVGLGDGREHDAASHAWRSHLVVSDLSPDAVKQSAGEGAVASSSLDDLVRKLTAPRAAWIMVPPAILQRKPFRPCSRDANWRHHH